MPAEGALHDLAFWRAVEHRAPPLGLVHPLGRFPREQLDHAPVIQVLPAAHCVREVDLPAVLRIDVREGRCDAPLRHHGVRLPEERFADETNIGARFFRRDRGAQSRASGADDQDVVFVLLERFDHQKNRMSVSTPAESSRT